MGGLPVLVLALGACRFAPAPVTLGDAQGSPEDAPDAPADALVLGAWGPATAVIPAGGDDDPTLTADMLELYFNRTDDIYVITRSAIGSPWTAPALVAELSSASTETTPEITGDGLTIFIGSARPGAAGADDIWVSTRATRAAVWGVPVRVPELSSTSEDAASAPTDDLKTIVLTSDRTGGLAELYLSTRGSVAALWSTPASIVELNTATGNFSPFLSEDQLTLYFDSTRGTSDDLYTATRPTTHDPFAAPVPIVELNTASVETDPWVSPDGRHIFFNSDRSGTAGLWEASR